MDSSVKRGDIFYADLSPVVGSEQGGCRPVLIVQNNMGNRHSPTVIAAAITSQMNKARLPTHIELVGPTVGLTKNSVVLLEQVRTIDKKRLRVRATLPTSRLPKGRLLSGRVVYEQDAWRPFPGGCMGGVTYPPGQRKGNCLRFPWKMGMELPAMEVFCFYRLGREKERVYLELRLDSEGRPLLPE